MASAAVQSPISLHIGHTEQVHQRAASATQTVTKHDVHTFLNFLKPNADGSPPAPAYVGRPETYERPKDVRNVIVRDVTGEEHNYSLDSHGFQFVPHVSGEKEFIDEEQIKTSYYKEVDQLLKDVTGASRVFIFDHTIRRQPIDTRPSNQPVSEEEAKRAEELKKSTRGPIRQVHIDQSYSAALSRVPFHLPDEAETLLKGRVQLINVWKPIKTVKRDPLGVTESQSVAEDDLVPVGLIYENRNGETLAVKHNANQKWFYKWHQTPEEALLIKCFDSRAGVESAERYRDRAKRVAHSAFEIPGTEDEEARESIEVRCLVFHEHDLE